CALLRKKFKEDLFTSGIEYAILQDSSEPSNENTNVVNALREPFVGNQDPGKNSSQSPPQINHHCFYGCGDPLEASIRLSRLRLVGLFPSSELVPSFYSVFQIFTSLGKRPG
nr:hypothetical protein [Tanacetum cinerariifolium]